MPFTVNIIPKCKVGNAGRKKKKCKNKRKSRAAIVRLWNVDRKTMETELKIKYYIYDMFDKRTVTDSRAEAEASHEEGKFVVEVHITTWRTLGVSGQNIVHCDWGLHNKGK